MSTTSNCPACCSAISSARPMATPASNRSIRRRRCKVPGVKAVLTADDLKPLKLHWMPTLAGDVQAVLADEKVLFQGQEVAFVVAEDRYIAADAVELVEVDYEELPALVDPNQVDGRGRAGSARRPQGQDRAARMGRASTTITSSPGRSATPRERRAPWRKPRSSPRNGSSISASIPARSRPAAVSPRWTRSTGI